MCSRHDIATCVVGRILANIHLNVIIIIFYSDGVPGVPDCAHAMACCIVGTMSRILVTRAVNLQRGLNRHI